MIKLNYKKNMMKKSDCRKYDFLHFISFFYSFEKIHKLKRSAADALEVFVFQKSNFSSSIGQFFQVF